MNSHSNGTIHSVQEVSFYTRSEVKFVANVKIFLEIEFQSLKFTDLFFRFTFFRPGFVFKTNKSEMLDDVEQHGIKKIRDAKM